MEHLRRGARLLLATTPSLLAALAVTGCEPCSFIGCSDVPHMAVSAQFLDTNSGYPVPDTKVSVIVVNPDGTRDSVAGMTDQKGYVQLSAATAGKARGELLVEPPDLQPYRVPLPCGPSVVDGGSCALGTVVVNPRYTAKGELHYRPDWDRLGGGLLVTFHETHGPRLLKGGSFRTDVSMRADAAGRFPLLPFDVYASGGDSVFGTLTIHLQAPYDGYVSVIHDVVLTPDVRFRGPPGLSTYFIGPSLQYYMLFYDRKTHLPVKGVQATFTKTSGIPLRADSYTAISDTAGKAWFGLVPLAIGTASGMFIVRTPHATAPDTIANASLQVFDADDRLYAIYYVEADGHITPAPPGTLHQ